MNDFDLESKLKGIRVPERPDEYWEDFPSRIRVQLRRERLECSRAGAWRLRLAWTGGFALAAALVFVCIEYHPLQTMSRAIAKQERHVHMHLARLDTGLHKLMLNTDGMWYLLAEPD